MLKGPASFTEWAACWKVFRGAMVSLLAATPQTLDHYEAGIERLVKMYPKHWGVVFCADQTCRQEMWEELSEELEEAEDWTTDEDGAWDKVIRLSTYGGSYSNTKMLHWWNHHVVFPLQTPSSAVAFLQDLEGTNLLPFPTGMLSTSASSASTGAAWTPPPPGDSHDTHDRRGNKRGRKADKNGQANDQGQGSWGTDKGGGKGGRGKADNKGKGKWGKAPKGGANYTK